MAGPGIDSQLQQASDGLLGRITAILDAAREHVVRTVNQATVSVYWHIGREIVEAVQQGDERAAYGKTLVEIVNGQGLPLTATNYVQEHVKVPVVNAKILAVAQKFANKMGITLEEAIEIAKG